MDVPQTIAGRFRVERELGRGGMSAVYLATHLGLQRPVAIKVLKQEFAANTDVFERFMREARTMARLRHPRAAMIFDAGILPDERPFIIMEYVEGETLADVLACEGRFAPERAVHLACQISDVLEEAHRLGIVHRDLKPSNIMLSDDGVHVLDFGIAKVLATSVDSTKTHQTTDSNLVIGTPRYMSPEQCMGQPIGPPSDLYSLGVLLYEMLAGRPPFIDVLPSVVLIKQATAPPPPLPALRADVPRNLAQAIHRLLAKSPADRPRTAASARALLSKSIMVETPQASAPEDGLGHVGLSNLAAGSSALPFAATLSTVSAGGSTAFRIFALAVSCALLSALLIGWGRGTLNASANAPATAGAALAASAATTNTPTAQTARHAPITTRSGEALSPDAAERIAAAASSSPVSEALTARTRRGPVIAAVHQLPRTASGGSYLSVLERQGGRYRVAARVRLDVSDFRGAAWTVEIADTDDDGYDEIICSSMDAQGFAIRRLVLYSPRTRQTFAVRAAPDGAERNTLRAIWTPNALTSTARPYRLALRQRALSMAAAL